MNQGCECKECQTSPHDSDCAVHNAPALPKGACDCKPMKLISRTIHRSRLGFQSSTVEEPATFDDVKQYLEGKGLIAITQDRLDIEHDVANLQGWLDGRSSALSMDTDRLVTVKNEQLGDLRRERRAMIAAAKEQG